MFGLEKKKKGDEFEFELERELSSAAKHREIKAKVEKRIEEIKQLLREGENKSEFDTLGLLLHGYSSMQKVLSRFSPK